MNNQELIATIRPDWPAESNIRVISHWGGLAFVEMTSVTRSDEDWTVQLDRTQAQALIDALQEALRRAV